ncbi:hypothetical protein VTO42DRAFT_335 [Malbranchea cinnamomea]
MQETRMVPWTSRSMGEQIIAHSQERRSHGKYPRRNARYSMGPRVVAHYYPSHLAVSLAASKDLEVTLSFRKFTSSPLVLGVISNVRSRHPKILESLCPKRNKVKTKRVSGATQIRQMIFRQQYQGHKAAVVHHQSKTAMANPATGPAKKAINS